MEKVTVQKDHVTKTEFKSSINAINTILKSHSVELKALKAAVAEIGRSLTKLTGIILRMEERDNVYSDMYEMNKDNVSKLTNRVSKLEKHSGVTPPQELLISGL